MGENAATGKNQLAHHQVFDVSVDVPQQGGSKCFDDDGRLKRTGMICSDSLYFIISVVFYFKMI